MHFLQTVADVTWMDGAQWAIEVIVVAVTAGGVVYKAVVSGLHSKINGMEDHFGAELDGIGNRFGERFDRVDRELSAISGQVEDLSRRIRENSEQIAVLSDRWDRQNGTGEI